jgi:trehalose-6-phosphate synthase
VLTLRCDHDAAVMLLVLEQGGLIGVEYDRRIVMVVMSHVGIEPDQLNAALKKPIVREVSSSCTSSISKR